MSLRFRDDYQEVLIDWLTRARRSLTGKADLDYELLSPPHRNSPFLTLAELAGGTRAGLPRRVLKLLLVLDDDASEPFWSEILTGERDRWLGELRKRLSLPGRVEVLGLPLSPPKGGFDELVRIAEIGPIRCSDLLFEAPPDASVRFSYLERPFIAWPRLCEIGDSLDQLKEKWKIYCDEHGVERRLREPLFLHFCDEALIAGRGELLLTSAWRLELLE